MRLFRSITAAQAALALAVAIPLTAPRAAGDCASLDIAVDLPTEFSDIKCDTGNFGGGGPSRTEESIVASGMASIFVVHHAEAGVRTYFNRQDTRALIDSWSPFGKIADWSAAPGGNQFVAARFKGWLTGKPDLPLGCFAFSRYTSHVARSSGFRQLVYGFYCTAIDEQVGDAEVRHLIGAIKFSFE
jgi:hypothetical protein